MKKVIIDNDLGFAIQVNGWKNTWEMLDAYNADRLRGYIGSHLLKRLTKQNSVVGFDLADGQDLMTCEFNEEFDLIIHLAGQSGVRDSMKDPGLYWRNNVEVSKRLFARYPNTRIMYASSRSAYEPDLNPYAATKYCVEEAQKEITKH